MDKDEEQWINLGKIWWREPKYSTTSRGMKFVPVFSLKEFGSLSSRFDKEEAIIPVGSYEHFSRKSGVIDYEGKQKIGCC